MTATRNVRQAKRQGYIVTGGDERVADAFDTWTQTHDKPHVRVRPRRRYATVDVDLVLTRYSIGEHAQREIARLFRAHQPGWQRRDRDEWFMRATRIPIADAADVAKQIVAIVSKPGYLEPARAPMSPLVDALDEVLRTGVLVEEGIEDEQSI